MQEAVTKGEFASIIGVSPGRVSQYLAAGQISQAALVGSGRSAKILVGQARADLRLTLDVAQRLGNGSETRLDHPTNETTPADSGFSQPAPQPTGGIDYEIKQQKLEQARRANRNAAIAEARDKGVLVEALVARAEQARIASSMLDIFEGGLTDMANAVAAAFQLPQRDVKHIMRAEFRKVRETAAKQMKQKAIELPEHVQIVVEADELMDDVT